MHPLSWFQERIKKTIKRINTSGKSPTYSYVPLDEYWANRCFEQQSATVAFDDTKVTKQLEAEEDPLESTKPIRRIHKAPQAACVACEG